MERYLKKEVPVAVLTILCVAFGATGANAEEGNVEFNPSYIIGNVDMLDHNSMDANDIQRFLDSHNSYLADYSCDNAYGTPKSAAEIIYDAATNNYDCDGSNLDDDADEEERKEKCEGKTTISPKVLLVMLQKEMSLVTEQNPSKRQLDWALGYGCPDGGECSSRWRGFGKQVNSAALQFKDYMENPQYYHYREGNTYTFTNPYGTISDEDMEVEIYNQATAALYNYTPHVYNGNYNFFKLWNRYFTKTYPDGSLLRAEGEVGVWLIDAGEKRPFLSKGALTSRYDMNKIITVSKTVLDRYPKGAPLKFSNYSLVRAPSGDMYLLVDDKKRKFVNYEAFRNIGFNPEEVISASWQDIRSYTDGAPISATSTYPTGALLQNPNTGGVYWVYAGERSPLIDPIFLNTKFKYKHIIKTTTEELEKYEKAEPVKFDSGELIKPANRPSVYLVDDGEIRPFVSGKTFEGMGYKWENIITVNQRVLDLYEEGEIIEDQY